MILFKFFYCLMFLSLNQPINCRFISTSLHQRIRNVVENNALHNNKELRKTHNTPPLWPHGRIPFLVDKDSYDTLLENRLNVIMRRLESESCIIFKRLHSHPSGNRNWVHVTNPEKKRECIHQIEHQPHGEIRLILGLECLKSSEILHTLLHAIGFHDETSHPGRGRHVRILWENIRPESRHLYRINNSYINSSVEYDPTSVMHFHDRAFSMNGQFTIAPVGPNVVIAPSISLSQLDKAKLRIIFGLECKKRQVSKLSKTCKSVFELMNTNIQKCLKEKCAVFGQAIEISDCDSDVDSKNCFN